MSRTFPCPSPEIRPSGAMQTRAYAGAAAGISGLPMFLWLMTCPRASSLVSRAADDGPAARPEGTPVSRPGQIHAAHGKLCRGLGCALAHGDESFSRKRE